MENKTDTEIIIGIFVLTTIIWFVVFFTFIAN